MAAMVFVVRMPELDVAVAAMIVMAAAAGFIATGEVLRLRGRMLRNAGLAADPPNEFDLNRVGLKLLGLYGTFVCIGFVYWLLHEYHGSFYAPFWRMLRLALPALIVLAVPYFFWTDRRQSAPHDGYYHAGLLFAGRWKGLNRQVLKQHALGWGVKAFFLPLMLVFFTTDIHFYRGFDFTHIWDEFRLFYDLSYRLLFSMDLLFATFGYVTTLRLFDAHIRSTQSTLVGWLAALICYQPLWSFVYRTYLPYEDGARMWGPWLANGEPFVWGATAPYLFWGGAILLLLAIYGLATVAFGLRFSNLTHRGIITGGPYRYSKHPAYWSKNLSWWLISVPFITLGSAADAVRHCLMLLMLNGIYWLRAYTEERHLSGDPVYVEYALAMNERSWLAPLVRRFPVLKFLNYRPPAPERAGR